jgi:NADH-quinone oxidoreductase subunit F
VVVKVLTEGIGEVDLCDIEIYRARGGYEQWRRAVTALGAAGVMDATNRSGLRGRGGAGFPTARKWSFLPANGRPRYLVCNSDEAEPGTFKDRMLLERTPHQVIEGILIGSYAIGSRHSFIYIRGEFAEGYRIFKAALAQARAAGFVGERIFGSDVTVELTVHRGAGAYICGEETALLNSLEGRRGEPRLKPPFPAVKGLYGEPTVVNNV